MDLLIQNARIITPDGDYVADVLTRGEKIAQIGLGLDSAVDTVVDASGKYLLPGCVDVHTHMDTAAIVNTGGTLDDLGATSDDFSSGTIAAAHGGTTTIVDFVEPARGQSVRAALANWHSKLERRPAVIDVGFHMIVRDLEGDAAEQIRELPELGITSLKFFMAYKGDLMVDDDVLFGGFRLAAETGAVAMVHAENGHVVDILTNEARARGLRHPRYHATTRPAAVEAEAVERAIRLAKMAGCVLYVVHVSSEDSLRAIARARRAGQDVWGETCPQYLVIDEAQLEEPDLQGAKYVFTPPPRTENHRRALWRALDADILSVIATDHSPFSVEKKLSMSDGDFSRIPNGAGGVEERLMVVHELGVRTGRMSLSRMVEVLAANPARLFGLYPRKGTIAIGSDADLVIFDPAKPRTLTAGQLHSQCDYTLYEGLEVQGVPESVFVRGEPVIRDHELVAEPGYGRFVKRAPFSSRIPPSAERPSPAALV